MCIIAALILIIITYSFGFLYSIIGGVIRRRLIAVFGWTGFSASGLIGVPFHEFSHLITALLFGHDITDFSLYRPIKGRKDGVLGYVNHTYNPNSLFQKTGNFFIGAAPMISGAVLLTVLYSLGSSIVITDMQSFEAIFNSIGQFFSNLFDKNIFSILMLFTAVAICPHIGMSGADFKNMFAGTFSTIIAAVVVPPYICYYTEISNDTLVSFVFSFVILYSISLFIGFVIDLFVLLIISLISLFFGRKSSNQ